MTFTALLLITLTLLYLYLTRNFNYWRKRNVPFITPKVVFGNIFKVLVLKQCVGEFLWDIYNAGKSSVVGFFVFDRPYLLIRSPELVKHILIKDFDYFYNRSVTQNHRDDKLGSNMLFFLRNPEWKKIRTTLTPVFTSGKLKRMFPLINKVDKELVNYIRLSINDQFEAKDLSGKYSMDVISSCAFGINSCSFKYENAIFCVNAKRVFSWNLTRTVQMFSYLFASLLVKPFRMAFIDPKAGSFLMEMVWNTVSNRENAGIKRGDLIDIINNYKKQNGTGLDGNMMVATAAQFFIGGFEAVGSAIAFTIYELCINPKVQTRLRNEITSTVKKHGTITYDAIQSLQYLDMVLSETLRKYPSLPFVERKCMRDYKIPNSDIVIEEGTPVYISLMGLHYDSNYFQNPEKFDPDRFLDGKCNSFLPFGDGPRNCIGDRFSLLSAKMAIVAMLTEFEMELAEATPNKIFLEPLGITLKPKHKLYMRFKPIAK